jgi:hypothetical protein
VIASRWVPNLEIQLKGVQLLVGYRQARGVGVGQIPLGKDRALTLAIEEVCSDILSEANGRDTAPWTAESGWERDEARVVQLAQLDEASVVRAALEPREYPDLSARQLQELPLYFYAFIVGPQPAAGEDNTRLLIVKKRDPRYSLGRRVVAVLDVALTRLTQPVFTFDSSADLVRFSQRIAG